MADLNRNKKGGIMLYYYLDNYGWIFIFFGVAVFIIFTLGAYGGGIGGSMYCEMPPRFSCESAVATATEVSFKLVNLGGSRIELLSASLDAKRCSSSDPGSVNARIPPRAGHRLVFRCDEFPKLIRGDVHFEYKDSESGLTYKQEGMIRFSRE